MGFFSGLGDLFGGISKVAGPITGLLTGNPWIGSALSAGLGYLGQQQTNAFNADQAALNRSFQERMSSTSYQRGVIDMRLAGLNPALAYQQGGASTPGGSSASADGNAIGAGLNSAVSVANMQAGLANTHADTALKSAQTDAASADASLKEAQRISTLKDADIKSPKAAIYSGAVNSAQSYMRNAPLSHAKLPNWETNLINRLLK